MSALDEIRGRLDAATPGPWEWDGTPRRRYLEGRGEGILSCAALLYPSERNAEFIAHAPADVAFLLDLVSKQQAALDAVRELADDASSQPNSEIVPVKAMGGLIRAALEGKA